MPKYKIAQKRNVETAYGLSPTKADKENAIPSQVSKTSVFTYALLSNRPNARYVEILKISLATNSKQRITDQNITVDLTNEVMLVVIIRDMFRNSWTIPNPIDTNSIFRYAPSQRMLFSTGVDFTSFSISKSPIISDRKDLPFCILNLRRGLAPTYDQRIYIVQNLRAAEVDRPYA